MQNPGTQDGIDSQTVGLALNVKAISGDAVAYSATGLPTGLTINSTTGLISGKIARHADASGPFSVTVTAADTTASVSVNKTFTWNVASLTQFNDPDYQLPGYELPPRAGMAPAPYLRTVLALAQDDLASNQAIVANLDAFIPVLVAEIRAYQADHPGTWMFKARYGELVGFLLETVRARTAYQGLVEQIEDTISQIRQVMREMGLLARGMKRGFFKDIPGASFSELGRTFAGRLGVIWRDIEAEHLHVYDWKNQASEDPVTASCGGVLARNFVSSCVVLLPGGRDFCRPRRQTKNPPSRPPDLLEDWFSGRTPRAERWASCFSKKSSPANLPPALPTTTLSQSISPHFRDWINFT